MCGIAGMLDLKGRRRPDPDDLQRMTDALRHRGPDGEGHYVDDGIGLGHRRLSILDIENGAQPWATHSARLMLTYNGEIYNYRDIAKAHNIPLKTRCDTELLAEIYERRGRDALTYLNGMFAFAVWDKEQRKLTLVRDRLGEKPLYYATTSDGWFLFASEISALFAVNKLPKTLCDDAIRQYFALGYVPDPLTIYRGVFRLPAATTLTVSVDGIGAPQSYWSPFTARQNQAREDDLLHLLDQAVSDQMVSDVPLGAFLSGGIDSSAVVSSMAAHRKAAGTDPVKTFTVSFPQVDNDDGDYAREVAALFSTDHHQQSVHLEAADLIDQTARLYGEPFADSSAIPTIRVCAEARKQVTVALSGDGADETFAGYWRYRGFQQESHLRNLLPSALRRQVFPPLGQFYPNLAQAPSFLRLKSTLQAMGYENDMGYFRAVSMVMPEQTERILSPELTGSAASAALPICQHYAEAKTDDAVLAAQYTDLKTWLSGRMMVKVDRAAMASSLEVRVPFLDHRLVEWAFSVPTEQKIRHGQGKAILKSALHARLPATITNRKKRGFDMPVDHWLRANNSPVLNNFLASKHWQDSGYFNASKVQKMAADHQAGRASHAQTLWSLIMFDSFLRVCAR